MANYEFKETAVENLRLTEACFSLKKFEDGVINALTSTTADYSQSHVVTAV